MIKLLTNFTMIAIVLGLGLSGCGGSGKSGGTNVAGDNDSTLELSTQRVVLTPGGSAVVLIEGGDSIEVSGLPDGVTATVQIPDSSSTPIEVEVKSHADAEAVEATLTLTDKSGASPLSSDLALSIQIPQIQGNSAEEYAPGVIGEEQTIIIEGFEVPVEVINGLAIAQGDIIIGPIHEISQTYELKAAPRSITCPSWSTGFTCNRWTDGVIGYNFANDWGDGAENTRIRRIIEEAIAHWEEQTGIRFVRRASGEWLEFRYGNGCASSLGRASITGFDSQSISLDNRPGECGNSLGTAIHEIGHAVGLFHEQSRDDRDEWVVVDFGQVQTGNIAQFFQAGGFASDVGDYDYASIMHYPPEAFAKDREGCLSDDTSKCTIRPLRPLPSGVNLGQRNDLSENDILGAFSLYPPVFNIGGANEGDISDEFRIWTDFETPLSPTTAARVVWTSDADEGSIGTGTSITLNASNLPLQEQTITASFMVAGQAIESDSIRITLQNAGPDVRLATVNGSVTQKLGLPFNVTATVTDDFDGSCDTSVCTYTWNPERVPFSGSGANTAFRFNTEGSHTITLTVEDGSGATGVGTLTVNIVNSAPVAKITAPPSNINVVNGMSVRFEGEASDENASSGLLACEALSWSSSNSADSFSPSASGCTPNITFSSNGRRTIFLRATDPQGLTSETDAVEINVTECDGNCSPTGFMEITSEPATVFEGSPLYNLSDLIDFNLTIADFEADRMDYTVGIRQAGSSSLITVRSGTANSVFGLTEITYMMSWLPDSQVFWSECFSIFRNYEFVVLVEDEFGGTNEPFVLPVRLGCTIE